MKVLIVSSWRDRYPGDARAREFPALSAIHLAGLCPPHVEVSVAHEQVRAVDPDKVDADLVAITTTTANATRAYELADLLRRRGISVTMGGPHPSLMPGEAMAHAHAVAVGDAEVSFPRMIEDFNRGQLRGLYRQPEGLTLSGLPVPRYDLLEDAFRFRCFVQATRGCPYQCTFCSLKSMDRQFRVRPISEVIRDIEAAGGRNWLQRKFVWFWDDNLTGNRAYARDLFAALRPLKRWWWTQCSIDAAEDLELLRDAARSGCLAVFIGVEAFSSDSLASVRKQHNRVDQYKRAVRAFHDAGIAVHAGIIVGFDDDSEDTLSRIPYLVADLGVDLPFVNLLTPFPSTPLRDELEKSGRLITQKWERHNAAGVTFLPLGMSPVELERAYWRVHRALYSPGQTARRLMACLWRSRLPAAALTAHANALFAVQNMIKPDGPWPSDSVAFEGNAPIVPRRP